MKLTTGKLLIIFLLLPIIAQSQNIRFGVSVEPQMSWFTSDTKNYSRSGFVLGFNGGFALERYFAERYAFTTGANISYFGGMLQFNSAGDSLVTIDDSYTFTEGSSAKIKGQYVSIPFGLKFVTNEIGYTTFYADLGVKSNFRLKAYLWEETLDVNREVLVNDQLNFAFVSYYIGAGVHYSLGGPSAILLGVNYSKGLTPPYKNDYKRISIGTLGLKAGLIF